MFDKALWIRQFKRRLRDLLGGDYDEGFASEIVETYWDRERMYCTPEHCAEIEASEHGQY